MTTPIYGKSQGPQGFELSELLSLFPQDSKLFPMITMSFDNETSKFNNRVKFLLYDEIMTEILQIIDDLHINGYDGDMTFNYIFETSVFSIEYLIFKGIMGSESKSVTIEFHNVSKSQIESIKKNLSLEMDKNNKGEFFDMLIDYITETV